MEETKIEEGIELKNKNLLGEVWDYLRIRKKWWLLPIILMILVAGLLIMMAQSSSLSPFIYTLF